MPRALITGITGQDGQYLAELLDTKGYEVFGVVTDRTRPRARALQDELPFVRVIEGDLADGPSLAGALEQSRPDEIYNLGAVSSVALSFEQPERTADVTGVGVLRMLEAARRVLGQDAQTRFYQASSSEMFGRVEESPQSERTPFHPRSPYGAAKVFGHHVTVNYREAYGMHAVSGILFNHESPRRGPEFVTRKISGGVARIKLGLQEELALGDLETKRDWGFAGDYVVAMWRMLQMPTPGDFVIATGESHSIGDFLEVAFDAAGLPDWRRYVRQDPRFTRPSEVDYLVGDPTRARELLGWDPKVSFEELVRMMVEHDLRAEAAGARGASGARGAAGARGADER